VRQQIEKTVAHLTGAAVPSSNERWDRRLLSKSFADTLLLF